ncbi:MAG: hypothetical protein AAB368_06995, partial [bacterium]
MYEVDWVGGLVFNDFLARSEADKIVRQSTRQGDNPIAILQRRHSVEAAKRQAQPVMWIEQVE